MAWDSLLLLLVGIYATYSISKFSYELKSIKFLSYASAALLFSLGQANLWIDSMVVAYSQIANATLLLELTTIIALSLVLCGLAIFIRESKPVFAQFPLLYAAAPLLLIVSYYFVRNSFAIKDWLLSIYEGGALLVALMMFGVRSYRNSTYAFLLAASILFTLTYIFFWFIADLLNGYSWIWQVLLGASIILTVKGFEKEISDNITSQN